MKSFKFQTVPQVVVEFGAARRLGALLREQYPFERLCLITDRFLHQSGLLNHALSSLKEAGWQVTVIDDVIADPPEHIVLDVARRAREAGCELVLGLGGGSSMDVAKLAAALVPSTQPLKEMYGIGKVSGKRLPLIQMPTTAGTGSEVTAVSIVTTGETTKMGVVSPHLYADLAILDAELTMGLPAPITAATGIDAMVHAIEAYTTVHLKNPVSDMLAIQALKLLFGNLLTACQDGSQREAREALLLGAMWAGQAFSNAPVAAVHALAYPLGGIFHVPHGLSNALVLPHVMRFNLGAASTLYAELADAVLPGLTGSNEAKATALITALEDLARDTAVPRTLREVGVTEQDLDRLAADAMLQTRLLGNNPRPVTEADARAIYAQAL